MTYCFISSLVTNAYAASIEIIFLIALSITDLATPCAEKIIGRSVGANTSSVKTAPILANGYNILIMYYFALHILELQTF